MAILNNLHLILIKLLTFTYNRDNIVNINENINKKGVKKMFKDFVMVFGAFALYLIPIAIAVAAFEKIFKIKGE